MTDHRPIDPRMPPEAYLYTQGRGRGVTMTPGPGVRLVREEVALQRINNLRAALSDIARKCQGEAEIIARETLEEDDALPNDAGARGDAAPGP